MNRRIVIIDQTETANYLMYFGCGLGDEIYLIQQLQTVDENKVKKILEVGPGDAVMLVGGEPFKYFRQFYHLGVRSENYYDCAKLRRLSVEGGAFVKCIVDFPDSQTIQDFLSPEFTKESIYSTTRQVKWKVLHTIQEAEAFLDWLEKLPLDTDLGFDYEGSGKPLDPWYELSGAAISTTEYAGFISFTDIRHQVGKNSAEYRDLLGRLGKFLLDRMSHIWTYNMQYEFQVSNRMLGVDLYNLCDASVVNVIDGEHMKKYSLKWTAQRVLQVNVWDTEFDRISDLVESMLFTIEGKLKSEKHRVLKVDRSNFERTPEWHILKQRYPEYIDEFRALILEYWGNEFMCIPSEILGKYCCLDSFYTLMIYKVKEAEYSRECWDVFLDNTRLGCRIMSGGLYIDEPFRQRYENYCHEQMAWGITYCAQASCWMKMEQHKVGMADIRKYSKVAIKLLTEGNFFNGDPLAITKYILISHLDTLDAYDTGIDEGSLLMDYGEPFASSFMDLVRRAMGEVKFKGKIDKTVERKKKILGIISEGLIPLVGLDKVKIGNKHHELEKYLYYERGYQELQRISKVQLCDIFNVPPEIYIFGIKLTLKDYAEYVAENYFSCRSPEENDLFVYEFSKAFRYQTAYLTALMESVQQMPGAGNSYSERGIGDINIGFQDFMGEWEKYFKSGGQYKSQFYPNKVFDLALFYFKDGFKTDKKVTKYSTKTLYMCEEKMKDLWTSFDGFNVQTTFFPQYLDQYVEYAKPFDPGIDLQDSFFFIRKMTLNYMVYKKYAKLDSTYVGSDGMFKKNNRYVVENENHIPIRYAKPTEPGAVEKCFVRYEVNEKSSKRWSSAFHTIISHSDIKDVLCPPPSWDENGNIVYGGSDQMLTYFDISSAEVKKNCRL